MPSWCCHYRAVAAPRLAPAGGGLSLDRSGQALWERGASGLDAASALSVRHGLDVRYGLPVLGGSETLDLYARGAFGESRAIGFGADLDLQGGLHLGYETRLGRSDADADADHRIQLRYQSRF